MDFHDFLRWRHVGSVMWFSNVTTTTHEQALRQRAEEDVPGFKEVMERYARVSNTRIGRPLYLPNVVICHNCDLRCHALLCLAYNILQHLTASYNILQHLTTITNHNGMDPRPWKCSSYRRGSERCHCNGP